MERRDRIGEAVGKDPRAVLDAENRMLREEIRVSREAAEITAHLVVEQFEKSEATLERLNQAKAIAEAALRESKGIIDNAPFGICFTCERRITRYNRAFGDIFGFSGESGIGAYARALFPSDEAYNEIGRLAGPLLSKNLPFEHEMRLHRQNGETFWGNLKAYISDPHNLSVGTVWMVQDRSLFKAAEAKIEKSVEEMTAIFEASTFGIAFIKDRVMLKANRKLEELFGYELGELRGQTTRCWYPDEESYLSVGASYNELAQGKIHRCVLKMKRKDGSLFRARLSGCALSSDLSSGSVWTVEDITAEYEANEAMLRAKESAESAEAKLRDSYLELEAANLRLQNLDQLKSDFLSSVSHELRTPLTSIRGFSQLIDREFARSFVPLVGDDAKLQKKAARIEENLAIILKESERLTRLINDVLDLAKIEAGRTEWRDALMPVAVFVRDAANAARGMFEPKPEVALCLEIEDGLPLFLGDADRLQQVLVNLLNNAAKFTDRGKVTVKAFLNPEKMIQIEVCDTGAGFPQEEAETIFDKFQQARQGDTLVDRPKGTGLGLAICREIVTRHGGCIWATSAPGQGSSFALTLPSAEVGAAEDIGVIANEANSAAGTQASGAAHAGTERSKVLVVDDDPAVRDYFSQLLQEQGYEVVTAGDGQSALVVARSHQPDLITMDLAMPVMDGRTAISLLRADAELKHIPIMVISAIPGLETAGGDVAMSKPLDESRFVSNIHSLLDHAHAAEERTKKVRFLLLYDEDQSPTNVAPENFSTFCEVGFCSIHELSGRIRDGFEGMVAIPADLLSRVDLGALNAAPALEIMIVPVASGKLSVIGSTRSPQKNTVHKEKES